MWPVLLGVYLVNASVVVMNYQFVNGLLFRLSRNAGSAATSRKSGTRTNRASQSNARVCSLNPGHFNSAISNSVLTVAYLANQFPASVEPYVSEESRTAAPRGKRDRGSVRRPQTAQEPFSNGYGNRQFCIFSPSDC